MWVSVHTQDQFGADLSDVLVQAYQDGTLIQQAFSIAGVALLNLDEDTYQIRQYYAGAPTTITQPYEVEISEDLTEFVVRTEVLTLPEPASPIMCQCSGRMYRFSEDYPEFMLQFQQPRNLLSDDQQVTIFPNSLRVQLRDGYGSIALPRTGRFTVQQIGGPEWEVQVPDLSTSPLQTVLFPLLKSITPESVSVSLSVGEVVEVPYSQLYYSGLILESADVPEAPERYFDDAEEEASVVFSSDDEEVVTIEDSGGVLSITGVAPGSTTIRAELTGPWYRFLGLSGEYVWEALIEVTVT